jgi:hypothetical protein
VNDTHNIRIILTGTKCMMRCDLEKECYCMPIPWCDARFKLGREFTLHHPVVHSAANLQGDRLFSIGIQNVYSRTLLEYCRRSMILDTNDLTLAGIDIWFTTTRGGITIRLIPCRPIPTKSSKGHHGSTICFAVYRYWHATLNSRLHLQDCRSRFSGNGSL